MERLESRATPATLLWTGQGSDADWQTPSNWVGGLPGDGDSLVFPLGVPSDRLASNNNSPVGTNFGSLSFSGGGYNLSGNSITLGSFISGQGSIQASAGTTNIAFDIQLDGAPGSEQFFNVNAGANLTLGGRLFGNTGVEIVADGPGTLVLANDNRAFTGNIRVTAGQLVLGEGGAVSRLNVQNALVGGGGTVDSLQTDGARVAPGGTGAVGILHAQTASFHGQTELVVDLRHQSAGAPVAGIDNDLLTADGSLFIDGSRLSGAVDSSVRVGDSFTIVQSTQSTVEGRFAEVWPGVVYLDGRKFRLDYSQPRKVSLTREIADTSIQILSSANPALPGETVTITAQVSSETGTSGTMTGTLTFVIDGVPQSPTMLNAQSQATLVLPALTAGPHVIEARYSGDANYRNVTASLGQRIGLEVDNTGDVADGNYAAGQFTLREAMQFSNVLPGTKTITFAPALSGQTIQLVAFPITTIQPVAIVNQGAELVTIDGLNQRRIFNVDNGQSGVIEVTLEGLRLTRGRAPDNSGVGGAIDNAETLTLTNCEFVDNFASREGGAVFSSVALTVEDCTFTANATGTDSDEGGSSGGAIAIDRGEARIANSLFQRNKSLIGGALHIEATATVVGSVFQQNEAWHGTAISNVDGIVDISATTVSFNRAFFGGAAVYNQNAGVLAVTNSTIAHNEGTGIRNDGDEMTIVGSTISHNSPTEAPAGISNSGTLTVINSTISHNSSQGYGGGVGNYGTATLINVTVTENVAVEGAGIALGDSSATVTLHNTIVAGNKKVSGQSDIYSEGAAIGGDNNLIGIGGSGGLSDGVRGNRVGVADIRLGPLRNNGGPTETHAPLSDSPAIDAGANARVPVGADTDQRGAGYVRIVGARVDIGAYERYSITRGDLVVDDPGDEDDRDYSPGDLSLREAVRLANEYDGPDTILFAEGLGPITLKDGQLTLTDAELTVVRGVNQTIQRYTGWLFEEPRAFRILQIDPQAEVELRGLTIQHGEAPWGAGISNQGTTTIVNTTIGRNYAEFRGGGIDNNGKLRVNNALIWDNAAGEHGGGLNINAGEVTLTNVTLTANTADDFGGGIMNFASLLVTNSTLTDNTADWDGDGWGTGGAIWTADEKSTTIHNSIAALNYRDYDTPDDLAGIVKSSSSHNLIGTGGAAGLTDGVGGNQVGMGDPGLGPLAFYGGPVQTFALRPDSPAIDAGSNLYIQAGSLTDARGAPFNRVAGGIVDIGAFERQTVAGLSLVVDSPDDENDGNYSSGHLSLREAVLLANGNVGPDIITFAASLTQAVNLTEGTLALTDSAKTTITGINQVVQRSEVDGVSEFGVFYIGHGAVAEITGLTIRNGAAVESGGGIYNAGTLTLVESRVTQNIAYEFDESSSSGGGIFNIGSLTIVDSRIDDNDASYGGGLYNSSSGTAHVLRSSFSANDAGAGGGAIFNNGDLTLTQSALTANVADSGGGMTNAFGALHILNTTIAGNYTYSDGGGIKNFYGPVVVLNSTIAGNRANRLGEGSGGGGGISTYDDPDGSMTLFNTIVAGNLVGSDAGTPNDIGHSIFTPLKPLDSSSANNLIGDPASNGGLSHGSNGNVVGKSNGGSGRVLLPLDEILDPVLRLNGGTTLNFALVANSPALDAGSNPALLSGMTTDQRGAVRITDGPDADTMATVDIGAIEFSQATTVILSAPTTAILGETVTLLATVTSEQGSPTGTIAFWDDSTLLGTANLSGGRAQVVTNTLRTGLRSIEAIYSGDANYLSARDSHELTVDTPILVLSTGAKVLENQLGANVGLLTVEDPADGVQYTFSVSDTRFEMSVNQLRLKVDQSVQAVHGDIELDITATDQFSNTFTQHFMLNVQSHPFPWQNAAQSEDADGDGDRDINDAVFLIRQLRKAGGGLLAVPRPAAWQGGSYFDVDANGKLDIQDAIAVIRYLRRNRGGGGGEGEESVTSSRLPIYIEPAYGDRYPGTSAAAIDIALMMWWDPKARKK